MPSSYLLAADGTVLASHFGFRTADAAEYEHTIQQALAAAQRASQGNPIDQDTPPT